MSRGRVVLVLCHTEHCTRCEEDFTEAQLHAFDPKDNDHCPKCDARGTMTRLYGRKDENGQRLTEWQLGYIAERLTFSPSPKLLASIRPPRRRSSR